MEIGSGRVTRGGCRSGRGGRYWDVWGDPKVQGPPTSLVRGGRTDRLVPPGVDTTHDPISVPSLPWRLYSGGPYSTLGVRPGSQVPGPLSSSLPLSKDHLLRRMSPPFPRDSRPLPSLIRRVRDGRTDPDPRRPSTDPPTRTRRFDLETGPRSRREGSRRTTCLGSGDRWGTTEERDRLGRDRRRSVYPIARPRPPRWEGRLGRRTRRRRFGRPIFLPRGWSERVTGPGSTVVSIWTRIRSGTAALGDTQHPKGSPHTPIGSVHPRRRQVST